MREHEEYMEEKNEIDRLLEEGYTISGVIENLEGAFVNFTKDTDMVQLHIQNSDARKYFSFVLMKQKEQFNR
ncbi:hypothetical protein ACFPU1_08775 [Thalassorhabdus alkalitolerans]|uniref:Uncharacterized protein n=1 Tax=Thalassorhabdus alkalitolerans TaxID=2282697 RepID=A0ABW0YQR2_9BACI